MLADDLLHSFEKYLLRFPRGKKREEGHALDHARRVRNMLCILDPAITVESLKTTDCVQQIASHWQQHNTFAPGTKRAYLNSLGHFIDFVEHNHLGGFTKHHLRYLRKEKVDCQKSLQYEAKRRRATMREEQEESRQSFLFYQFCLNCQLHTWNPFVLNNIECELFLAVLSGSVRIYSIPTVNWSVMPECPNDSLPTVHYILTCY